MDRVELPARLDALHDPPRVLPAQGDKHQQRKHLEGQPGKHDVCARLCALVGARGGGGDAAPGGLQDEREEVAGDEDVGVPFRGDAGDVGAEDDDDA